MHNPFAKPPDYMYLHIYSLPVQIVITFPERQYSRQHVQIPYIQGMQA